MRDAKRKPKYKPLQYDHHALIFEAYAASPQPPLKEVVRRIAPAVPCDPDSVRGVWAWLNVMKRLHWQFPVNEMAWKALPEWVGVERGLSAARHRRHRPIYTYRVFWTLACTLWDHWQQWTQNRNAGEAPSGGEASKSEGDKPTAATARPASLHIAGRLHERDQLKTLIAGLPDPDYRLATLHRWTGGRPLIDPGLCAWPGCLMPAADGAPLPGSFIQLYEHLRDDPHWKDFGLVYIPGKQALELLGAPLEEGKRFPWTMVYDWFYQLPLIRMILVSHQEFQERARTTCERLGCESPMLTMEFVLRPIRDAVRMHLGKGPLPGSDYRQVYRRALDSERRQFRILYGGQVIAHGVDTRTETTDDAIVQAVSHLHEQFRQMIATDATPQRVVQAWQALIERGTEMISWLDSLTAADFESTACSGCAGGAKSDIVSEFALRFQASLEGGTTGGNEPPPDTDGASAPLDYLNLPVREGVSMVEEVVEGSITLQAGETKSLLNMKVPPGQIVVLTGLHVGAPGVEIEIEADGKKFRM